MEVKLLSPSGFCFGVSYAIKKIVDLRKSNENIPIYVFGMLIHNKNIIEELNKLNIITISKKDDLSKLEKGIMCSTAHGISKQEIDYIKSFGFTFVNATCPIVFKAIDNIRNELNNFDIIYLGKHSHPETIATSSISEKIFVIEKKEDCINLDKNKKYALTCQTTMTKMELLEVYDYLIKNNFDVKLIDDVCFSTTDRQKKLIEDGKNYDAIFIVGDPSSNNNTKLYNIALSINKNSYFIEDKNQLNSINLVDFSKVLVGSGTSTPQNIIDEVVEYLRNK